MENTEVVKTAKENRSLLVAHFSVVLPTMNAGATARDSGGTTGNESVCGDANIDYD